jgi:hypothetical protein
MFYPNPVKIGLPAYFLIKITDDRYSSQECPVRIIVFNPAGERVSVLTEQCHYGLNQIPFDTRDLAGGIYFYRVIEDGEVKELHKLVLFKY